MWRTDIAPFLREIQDSMGPDSGVEKVIVMKPVQCGATEILLNVAGFYLTHAPSTVMIVEPNETVVKRLSRQRIETMIELCAPLRAVVAKARSKGGNEMNLKTTRTGGVLAIASAQSAAALRSLPARVVLCDEVDAYLKDLGEGNPFDLASARATTFGTLRRIAAVSTPTEAGLSLIAELFAETDQRRWFVPCPLCKAAAPLTWDNLRWEPGEPSTARYRCSTCGGEWDESKKAAAVAAGEWRATKNSLPRNSSEGYHVPENTDPLHGDSRIRGYHFNALISPWVRWSELVTQFEAAADSIERKKTFTNLVLAEVWQDAQSEMPGAAALASRCEPYAAEAPAGVALVTAGVDLQHDRAEVELVGWGRGFESWSLAYHTVYGDPTQPQLWALLDELLAKELRHESGMPLRISAACVDAGFLPDEVLAFTKERFSRRIYAVKSLSVGWSKPIWPRKAIYNRKALPLFLISADEAKTWVHNRLKIADAGPGFCHFPIGRPVDYFSMLTVEKLVTRTRNGRPYREWLNPKRERNEALDCRCYAVAALHSLLMQGVNLDAHVAQFEAMLAPPPTDAPPPKPNGATVYRSRFVNG